MGKKKRKEKCEYNRDNYKSRLTRWTRAGRDPNRLRDDLFSLHLENVNRCVESRNHSSAMHLIDFVVLIIIKSLDMIDI